MSMTHPRCTDIHKLMICHGCSSLQLNFGFVRTTGPSCWSPVIWLALPGRLSTFSKVIIICLSLGADFGWKYLLLNLPKTCSFFKKQTYREVLIYKIYIHTYIHTHIIFPTSRRRFKDWFNSPVDSRSHGSQVHWIIHFSYKERH